MDVAQDLIYTTSRFVYSKQLMILFFKLTMPIKGGILLKDLVSYNFLLKNLHDFTPTIYKNFKSVFLLTRSKRKFGNLHACLICVTE